ncbi:hypothetical protein GCM10023083_44800 [Streptomyces phyllanthi]
MRTSPVAGGGHPAEGDPVATAIRISRCRVGYAVAVKGGTPMRIARDLFVSAAIIAFLAISAPVPNAVMTAGPRYAAA